MTSVQELSHNILSAIKRHEDKIVAAITVDSGIISRVFYPLPSNGISEIPEGYKCYKIRQGRSGKLRQIEEPYPWLKEIQKAIIPLFEQFPLHPSCMARKGFSIRDNAKMHEDAKYVLRIDIKGCYQSITMSHILKAIGDQLESKKQSGLIPNLMSRVIDLCFINKDTTFTTVGTTRNKNFLPTGAPTSPVLCNIALTPIDIELSDIADIFGYTYTRYIDDLHFSTTSSQRHWNLIDEVTKVLTKHSLSINKKKTRWYTVDKNDNVIITGVRVKNGCKAPREFVRIVRARLQNLAKEKAPIDAETRGCLAYINSIDQEKYESLLQYYEKRLSYESANRGCISAEQILSGSTSSNSQGVCHSPSNRES
jgi:retron-type reverse transcriptase